MYNNTSKYSAFTIRSGGKQQMNQYPVRRNRQGIKRHIEKNISRGFILVLSPEWVVQEPNNVIYTQKNRAEYPQYFFQDC